jgi:hypothetical protein
MKKVKLILLLVLISVGITTKAQVHVNVNLGAPPVWGPTVTTEEYYYLPDIQSYYDIRQSQFIYLNNGTWIRSNSLPRRYKTYNLNTGQVIVINDYHGSSPYINYKTHKVKYVSQKKWITNKGNNGNHSGKNNGKGNKKGKH